MYVYSMFIYMRARLVWFTGLVTTRLYEIIIIFFPSFVYVRTYCIPTLIYNAYVYYLGTAETDFAWNII